MTALTMKQAGKYLSRGDFGERVDVLHRVIFDPELNGWREATADDKPEHTSWGAWDSTFGWMAPWDPE